LPSKYGESTSLRDYIGSENFKYEAQNQQTKQFPTGEEIYSKVLSYVAVEAQKGSIHSSTKSNKFSTLSHQSLLRTNPKELVIYSIVVDQIEKSMD
jgi:hypothetical protein